MGLVAELVYAADIKSVAGKVDDDFPELIEVAASLCVRITPNPISYARVAQR